MMPLPRLKNWSEERIGQAPTEILHWKGETYNLTTMEVVPLHGCVYTEAPRKARVNNRVLRVTDRTWDSYER